MNILEKNRFTATVTYWQITIHKKNLSNSQSHTQFQTEIDNGITITVTYSQFFSKKIILESNLEIKESIQLTGSLQFFLKKITYRNAIGQIWFIVIPKSANAIHYYSWEPRASAIKNKNKIINEKNLLTCPESSSYWIVCKAEI